MTPADTEPGIEQLRAEPASPKFKHLKYSLALAGIFASALAIRLWFNFSAEHANCAGCCDASEYVRNAAALKSMLNMPNEFWQKFFQTAFNTASAADADSVRSVMASMKEVYQAGPVFPLFLNFSFAIAGSLFPANSLGAPILVQSVLSAIACCLIADFTSKAWKNSVGYTAGLIAAVYPGFIVNSGRLYTESFATFLVCLTLAVVVRGFFTVQNAIPRGFAAGVLATCLQLTRSILVLLSVLLIPITIAQQKHAHWKQAAAALLTGFACVILPWICFQHAAFNKGGIVVDRVGNYNLFIGSNTQTQGWLTFPYPDGHGIEKKSLPSLLGESLKSNPGRFVRLMIDKPARLFQLPWNDFRTPIGPMDAGSQTLMHQAVLLFALLGATLAFFTGIGKETPTRSQMYARFLLGGFAALHLIYALFITVPRYAVTAMPSTIAFAAAGLIAVFSLLVARKTSRLGVALIVIAGVLWAGQYNNLVQPLMELKFLHDATIALGIQIAVKAVLLLLFTLLIWTTFSETSGYRRLAKIVTALCAVVSIPLLVLPGRAAGRWFEWQKPISESGISQTLTVPKNIGNRQAYLMIDADGLNALANADIFVNGKKLGGPIIPGMALAQDYSTLQHVDKGKVTWEGENIFNYMTRPADISNSDLRQWFLLPVPKAVANISGVHQLQVTLKRRANTSSGVIYGSYTHGKKLVVPSLTIYSWEKAFYGVENPNGLSDPRLDDSLDIAPIEKLSTDNAQVKSGKIATKPATGKPAKAIAAKPATGKPAKAIAAKPATGKTAKAIAAKPATGKPAKAIAAKPATSKTAKQASVKVGKTDVPQTTSSEPESSNATASAIPNIRLVVGPPGSDGEVESLKAITPTVTDLSANHLSQPFAIYSMPEFSTNDIWIVRTVGDIKSENQIARPSFDLTANCGKSGIAYQSPWVPMFIPTTNEWQHFEISTPLAPGQLPGGIAQIVGNFVFDAPQWKTTRVAAPDDRVQLRNVRIEIIRLPGNPLAKGYIVQ